MPRLIWSAAGLRDVQRLYRFLADKDENAARRAISAIRQGFKTIARQPGIGRPADDMDPEAAVAMGCSTAITSKPPWFWPYATREKLVTEPPPDSGHQQGAARDA